MKHSQHKPYNEMQSLKTPKRAWQSIVMNFITKLPSLKDLMIKVEYDSILVIIDRLTKYVHILLYIKALNVMDLAYIFL
jgi:hypothetical protein